MSQLKDMLRCEPRCEDGQKIPPPMGNLERINVIKESGNMLSRVKKFLPLLEAANNSLENRTADPCPLVTVEDYPTEAAPSEVPITLITPECDKEEFDCLSCIHEETSSPSEFPVRTIEMDVCLGVFDMPNAAALSEDEARQRGITVVNAVAPCSSPLAVAATRPSGSSTHPLIQELSSDSLSSDSESDTADELVEME